MSDKCKALPDNADDLFFVDSAYVKRQPQAEGERLAAEQALLSCPSASIGTREKIDLARARSSFPLPMADGVYLNGFNHRGHGRWGRVEKGTFPGIVREAVAWMEKQ